MEGDSDTEIYEFLSKQGVTTTQINHMMFNGITSQLLRTMKEDDMKEFIPKYSQRVALRDYLNLKLGNRRKEKLVHDLKLKMKRYGLENYDQGTSKMGRADRQIFLGWVMCWDGKSYKQVREPLGGGTRKLYLPVTANKKSILQKATDLFFPNGTTCKNLKIEDYEVDLFNSQHQSVDQAATIKSILMDTSLQKLRFYLATKPTETAAFLHQCQHVEVDISSDDSYQLVSYRQTLQPSLNTKISTSTVTSGVYENEERRIESDAINNACKGNSQNKQGEGAIENHITLTDILIFATGADHIPPLGFPVTPQITFLHEDTSSYPKANTCSMELKLPVIHKNYEEFIDALNFGIANCNSFGLA